jgi:hypothetical protein
MSRLRVYRLFDVQCLNCGRVVQRRAHGPNRDLYCSTICANRASGARRAAQSVSRFWMQVARGDGCWLWMGPINQMGYGRATHRGRRQLAHRVAFELTNGPVPDGLVLDHLCRVKACVNPAHLEAVTNRENVRRGLKGVLTTHCPKGHPYDEVNTHYHEGHRYCRACGRASTAARRKRQKEGVTR